MSKKNTDSPQPNYSPDFSFEQELRDAGMRRICGIDEAGRGPLAGPVVAAAVILDPNNIPVGLHDSKKLTEKRREVLYDEIMQCAFVAISCVSAKTIDRINIRAASLLAMTYSAQSLECAPDYALIDGNALPENLPCPAKAIVKGDARSVSIAAASIIAKVTRDRLMVRMEEHCPGYGLAKHKGYPTKVHREALLELGPSPLHRLTFGPGESGDEVIGPIKLWKTSLPSLPPPQSASLLGPPLMEEAGIRGKFSALTSSLRLPYSHISIPFALDP